MDSDKPDDLSEHPGDDEGKQSARGGPLSSEETHTEGGAPTDKAHRDAGDGALAGSIPAGLTPDELRRIAEEDSSVESGTG